MGFIDIMTKPLRFGSRKLAWQEPLFYPIRMRGDALRRLLIALGIGLIVACIILCVFFMQEQPRDRDFALAGGLFASLFALLFLFFRRSNLGGSITFRRDTIQRISFGFPYMFLVSNARWDYGVISNCVFILGKDIGHSFSIMLFSYGGSQQMIAIPKQIDPRQIAALLAKHGVRVQRGRRLPEYATQGLSLLPTKLSVAAGLFALMLGPILYVTQGPPTKRRPTPQYPQAPGLDEMRSPPRLPSFPPAIDAGPTAAPGSPQARPNLELDEMRQMRQGMRPMRDGMSRMREGMTPMRDGMRRGGPQSVSPPSPPPGLAAPAVPRSNDNTKAAPYDLTETVGTTEGFEFKDVDYRSRPVIGVRFAMISRAGKQYIRRLTPIFYRSSLTSPNKILAKEGYALGAIHVWANEFVTGVKLEFMKLKDDTSLQLSDSYQADTIGTATTGTAKIITTDGRIVVGLHGRRTSLMNAIGLALRK